MVEKFDKIIIGAGLYGLYAAEKCGRKGEKVLILECDPYPFSRATYINQARVHMGYHYPRSITTALKSAGYFSRFNEDYGFCIHSDFNQIYATSSTFSYTDSKAFIKFCDNAGIPCEEICASKYFRGGLCDGAFLTKEYTYDAEILRDYFLNKIEKMRNVKLCCGVVIDSIRQDNEYLIDCGNMSFSSAFVLNATYAAVNNILALFSDFRFKIKYELCEIILCDVSENLKDVGLTVMDGPFFSIMPFGKTGYHSLTSVTFTPHSTCYEDLPNFACQEESGGYCSSSFLGNCNICKARPNSAWNYMSSLARKYMLDEYRFDHQKSLFSMKPILLSSEVDDSRPTVIRVLSKNPTFVSVLSGKINTVYDLDEYL